MYIFFFFFNDTATTEIYTLSLHDALPISSRSEAGSVSIFSYSVDMPLLTFTPDRKSTRLNSSHTVISYAVFCLKKKKKIELIERLSIIMNEKASYRNSIMASD